MWCSLLPWCEIVPLVLVCVAVVAVRERIVPRPAYRRSGTTACTVPGRS